MNVTIRKEMQSVDLPLYKLAVQPQLDWEEPYAKDTVLAITME
jgi:hypothetical protein